MPNIPKYSRSFSLDVCQLRPPTNSLPGAVSFAFGVDLPDELPPLDNAWLLLELVLVFVFTICTLLLLLPLQFIVAALTGIKALCKSCSTEVASMTPLEMRRKKFMIEFCLNTLNAWWEGNFFVVFCQMPSEKASSKQRYFELQELKLCKFSFKGETVITKK